MAEATVVSYVSDRQGEQVFHCVLYSFTGVAKSSTSTELVSIEVPAFKNDTGEVREHSGNAELAIINTFRIHSASTDYDVKVLNSGDMTAVETINEILAYTELNKVYSDSSFDEYVFCNRDDPRDDKLYVWMKNDDSSNDMGTTTLELAYRTAQYNV